MTGLVCAIYQQGIATGDATFAAQAPAWGDWDAGHLASCRLIALQGEDCTGWAALSPVSGRCVDGGVAEVSVYVAAAARGRGVGRLLLTELVRESERNGLWTLQAGIFPEQSGQRGPAPELRLSPGRPPGKSWARCRAAGATSCCSSGAAPWWGARSRDNRLSGCWRSSEPGCSWSTRGRR